MRRARLKGEPEAEVAYYHCVSRIVDRRFVLEAREREIFVRLMRGYKSSCKVRIITLCGEKVPVPLDSLGLDPGPMQVPPLKITVPNFVARRQGEISIDEPIDRDTV
jgi:hypothetical protein